MRRPPILGAVLAAFLASCAYPMRAYVPLAAGPQQEEAKLCVTECQLASSNLYRCYGLCPGAKVEEGTCNDNVPAGGVCAEGVQKSKAGGTVGWIVLGVVLAAGLACGIGLLAAGPPVATAR